MQLKRQFRVLAGEAGVEVAFETVTGERSTQLFGKILVAVGRRPNSEDLGLENTAVVPDAKGFVPVDAQRRTSESSIFAIGDIAGEPMLAHKASHEAAVAVEAIAGHKVAFEPKAIPAVVFTDPSQAPEWLPLVWWTLAYTIFVVINVLGVELTLRFGLIVTGLAAAVLVVFYAATLATGSFDTELLYNIPADEGQTARGLPHGWLGVFSALPFGSSDSVTEKLPF